MSALFHAACQLRPEQRAVFLAQACAGDEGLRYEVEKLLAGHERAGDFLNQPAYDVAADLFASSPVSSVLLPTGRRLGRYQIRSCVGAGGMGEIYLAEDTQLDRLVAIKLLPPEFTNNAEMVRRFIREAKAVSALNHPNIVTIHEIGEEAGLRFIVTEYIEGQTLRKRMATEKLRLTEALDVAIQILCALAVAHGAGIVHRDIKPENIMLRPDGYIKVLDFGLAKLTERSSPERAPDAEYAEGDALNMTTKAGVVMGTAHYMSPEQALGLEVDSRADVFSLGVVLYEMIAGRTPFNGVNAVEVMGAILNQEPRPLLPDLREVRPAVAAELERVIAKALSKNRDDRYHTADEMLADLRKLKRELTALASVPAAIGKTVKAAKGIRELRLAAAPLLAMVMIGAAVYLSRGHFGARSPTIWNPRHFAGLPGKEDHPSFSPDGSQLAFDWNGGEGDNYDIYIKQVGVGSPLRLTRHPAKDICPIWSPDGRYIAFVRLGAITHELLIIPALGGSERVLCALNTNLHYASWSADSSRLALTPPSNDPNANRIILLSVETGEVRPVTTPPPNATDIQPAISPDGRYLAFVRSRNSATYDIYLTPLEGGWEKRLNANNSFIDGLAWTEDSREIVYSAARAGNMTLWRQPVAGGEPEPLYGVGGNAHSPAISRRNHLLTFTEKYNDINIWRLDLRSASRRQGRRLGVAPVKFINFKREDHSPQISPDGRKVAFISDRSGRNEIWICDNDGNNPRQVTRMAGANTGTPRWAPDSKRLVFDSRPDGAADIFVINVDSGQIRRLTSDPAEDVAPSWSHDGRWIYFCSNRSGRRQIWKLPAEGGQALQITRNGGFEAFEAPDGKSVYYSKEHRGIDGLWEVPADGGEERQVPELSQAGYWRSWAMNKDGIYFVAHAGSPPPHPLKFFSFATRRVTQLAVVGKTPMCHTPTLTVSPDSRWLLYAQLDQQVSNLLMVENFR
ncbi:MAG TPA: protein kinase [Blastocatellia bacterium]